MNKLRKIGFLVLALVSALFVLVGCGKESGPTAAEAAARISTTVDKTTVTKDFVVNNSIVLEGVTFTVTWESNNKVATVGTTKVDSKGDAKENGGFYLVNIDYENNTADQNVTLTATVANGKDTATKSISFTVPKFATMTYAEFAAADDDTSVTVDGIVTGIISKDSKGNSTNALYVNALDSTGGFYVYGLEKNPVTEGIKEGMTVRVSGLKDTYSGTLEIVSASVKVTDETIKTVTPVDLTEAFVAAENLAADTLTKQALLVTLKGVIIGDQDQSNGYYYFTLGGKKAYLRISSSVCPVVTADTATIKNGHSEHTGWIANVTGVVCVYSGNFYLTPVSANCFEYISLPELSDAEQVATEKESLTIANTKYAANAEVELPLTGSAYKGVTISWASDNEAVAIDATTGKATITLGKSAVNVKLTATLTKGEETATKEFTLELASASGIEIVDPVNGQEFYFGLYQANLGKYLFFTGVPKDGQTFYQTTTEKLSESVKIKVTAVEGGYTLSFVEGGVTKYITMSITSDNKTSLDIKTNAADAGVFTYDAEHQTFIQTINDSKLFMGANNSYNTIAASWHKYLETNFPVHLYAVSDGYEEPSEPTEEPTYTEMTAAEANAAAVNTKLIVSGTVIAVNSRGFLVQDTTGIINIYASSISETVVIGDTVTVEGVLAAYSNAKQVTPEKITKGTAVSVTQPTATDITATADAFLTAQKDAPQTQYVKLTAKYTVSGNYHNLVDIEGATTAKGSLVYPNQDFSALVNKTVVVEGYFVYVTGSGVYINIMVVSMTEANAHVHAPATDWTKDETHHWHTCSGCSELVDKAEHTWTEGTVQTQPTETTEGLRVDTCACGATKNVVLPTLSHTHAAGSTWVSNDEKHWKECACGQDATKYEEADHVWNEGEETTPATETVKGVKTYTCTVCAKTKTEDIPMLPVSLPEGAVVPTVGKAYRMALIQGNLNKTLYITGEMDGFYYATTEDINAACDVYLEETTGGYHMYIMVGTAKKYMNIIENGTYINVVFEDAASSVWTYNTDVNTVVTTTANTEYFLGTRTDKEYKTFSACKLSYRATSFIAHFYNAPVVHEHEAATEWKSNDTHHWNACATCEDEVELNKAEHVWGEGEVTTQPTETEDGVRTFTCECGKTKTAVEPALGHTHAQTTTYAYDETNHWFVCACADADTKYEVAEHVWDEGEVTTQPSYLEAGVKTYTCVCGKTKTEEIEKLELPTTEFDVETIVDAKSIATTAGGNYTDEKYYVAGIIKEVYNTQYGNMYIQDLEGNELTVYGTYSYDGVQRYDAMTTKPEAGDYVVIYGILGTFNSNPQIKNGWIVQHEATDYLEAMFDLDVEVFVENVTDGIVAGSSIILPTTNYANVVWSVKSGDAIVIENGEITVTQPEIGENDADVILTATLTLGTFSEKIDVNVTVVAKVGAQDAPSVSYSYTFKSGDLGSNGSPKASVTLNNITWTASYTWKSTAAFNFDSQTSARGLQIGTSNAPVRTATLSASFEGKISEVVINASTASSASATLTIKVNGVAVATKTLTTTATDYTFTLSEPIVDGTVTIEYSQPSTSKALYIKTVSVK